MEMSGLAPCIRYMPENPKALPVSQQRQPLRPRSRGVVRHSCLQSEHPWAPAQLLLSSCCPDLQAQSGSKRAVAVTAVKYCIQDKPSPVDAQLHGMMGDLLGHIGDEDRCLACVCCLCLL